MGLCGRIADAEIRACNHQRHRDFQPPEKYDFVCLWFILLVCSRVSFLGFAIHAKEGEKEFDWDLRDEGCTGRPCYQGSGGQVHTKEGKKGSEGNCARRLLPPDQQGKRGERPFGNS